MSLRAWERSLLRNRRFRRGGGGGATCTGASGDCPTDLYKSAGTACDDLVQEAHFDGGRAVAGQCYAGDCVSLETLWLNGNQLKKIPKEIGNLVALETLDLSDNQLETLPKELANLDLLEQLDIYNNAFTKMPKALAPDGDMEEEGCNIVREEP